MLLNIDKINMLLSLDKTYDFFYKYKNILLISIFTGIFVNAIDVFTFKFGIDAEYQAFTNDVSMFYNTQRYGTCILWYLLPFARFHIISQITGIIALSFASLLAISRHNMPNSSKLLFMLLFITYPNFAFLQYFYFQSVYNLIGLLLVVTAYRLIEKNNIFAYTIAVLFLFIGISSYQANFAVFLTVMMINVILDFINDKNYKKALINIFKPSIVVSISIVFYYIVIKILSSGINNYHTQFTDWNGNFLDTFSNLFTQLYRILVSNNFYSSHTANLIISIIFAIIIIYFLFKSYKKKEYIFLIFLMFLFLLAIFSLHLLLLHSALPIRATLAIAFYPAFIILLIMILNKSNIARFICIIISLCIISYNAYYIVSYQTTYKLSWERDVQTANNLLDNIYDKYPEIYDGKYKLAFQGSLPLANNHPLMQGKDTLNTSFFIWDGGNPMRMLLLLKLLGLPSNVNIGSITTEMQETINKMPAYPNKDCIKLYKDTVIVKLR